MEHRTSQLRITLRIVIAPNWPAGISDEAEAFHPLTIKPAEEATNIPDTSSLSLWKLKQVGDGLERLNPTNATPEDVKRRERLSIRTQCLLSDMPGWSRAKTPAHYLDRRNDGSGSQDSRKKVDRTDGADMDPGLDVFSSNTNRVPHI